MQLLVAIPVAFALLQAAAGAHEHSPLWGQCGGADWTGATSCAEGSTCAAVNPYYSQCLPGASPTAPAPHAACSTPALIPGFNDAALPNPFLFDDGTPVTSAADWACRRAQILALIQGYEAGALPGPPDALTATLTLATSGTNGTLSITASNGNASITFAPTLTFPPGDPPAAGWPLVIVFDSLSLPIPPGIATLTYSNSEMAQQNNLSSRGVGLFYDLFGASASASAMTAWTWGVSRILDALERTPAAHVDPTRIAVTGCSRDGKGALMAGALEPRIALTIPQESGSGGDTCWRLSLFEQQQGSDVQTAAEIVTENVWFSAAFAGAVGDLAALPYDHHMLAALVAPRALVSYENTEVVWLSPMSAFGCMSAAREVWGALGVADRHGFEQVGGHEHCVWPAALTPSLDAFFGRFLLGQENVSTDFFATNNDFGNATWTASQWINWTTPTLA